MTIRNSSSLAGVLVISLAAFEARADWGRFITNERSRLSDLDGNGVRDCYAGSFNGEAEGQFPGGGWFENMLYANMSVAMWKYGRDFVRRCPRSFSEVNHNHSHGVFMSRLAVVNRYLFAVYGASDNYFSGDKIILQQDPQTFGANAEGNYAVASLWRNSRNFIDTNPWSAEYIGTNCNNVITQVGGVSDPAWATHWETDQFGTQCRAPGQVQTFDPDITTTSSTTYITWIERVIEAKYRDVNTGVTTYGLAPGDGGNTPRFPYNDHLKVHVESLATASLPGGAERASLPTPGGPASTAHTPMTSTSGLLGNSAYDAFSPRITTVSGTAVVAWAEGTFSLYTNPRDSHRAIGRTRIDGLVYRVRQHTGGVGWTDVGTSVPGVPCNEFETSSGKPSDRREITTGTHDIATMTIGGVERPVLVYTVTNGTTCELRSVYYNGANWVQLGSGGTNLAATAGGIVRAPRITVHNNYAYITWSELTTAGNHAIYMRRYNGTAAWDLIGGNWAGSYTTDAGATAVAWGFLPSITVADAPVVHDPMSIRAPMPTVFISFYKPGNHILGRYPGYDVAGSVHPNMVVAKQCQLYRTSFPAAWICAAGGPSDYSRRAYSSAGEFFDPQQYLGVGQTNFGMAMAPLTYASTMISRLYAGDTKMALFEDGSTDLAIAGTTQNGRPDSMFVGFAGGLQTHRYSDKALMALRDSPPAPSLPTWLGHDVRATLVPTAPIRSTDPFPVLVTQSYRFSGSNNNGKAGANTQTNPLLAPVNVTLPTQMIAFGTGRYNSCYIESDGKKARCVGLGLYGVNSTTTNDLMAWPSAQIDLGSVPAQQVSIGERHACARITDGTVKCWGDGDLGALGDGLLKDSLPPVQVKTGASAFLTDVIDLQAGRYHQCALNALGEVWCWGYNTYGQVGNTIGGNISYATKVNNLSTVRALRASGYATCAITTADEVRCWGYGGSGQLGNNSYANSATPVVAASGATDMQMGEYTGAALKGAQVYTWGDGVYGWHGDGGTNKRAVAAVVPNLTNVTSIWAGGNHLMASVKTEASNGSISYATLAWGKGTSGELGNGFAGNKLVPSPVASHWDAVAPACAHATNVQGVALAASCENPAPRFCVADICQMDSYCCTTYWDSICTGHPPTVVSCN